VVLLANQVEVGQAYFHLIGQSATMAPSIQNSKSSTVVRFSNV